MKYFFDRNFGKNVPQALRLLGINLEYHAEVFGEINERKETSDDYWLEYCGRNRLTVIAHDQRFLQNMSEREAIAQYKVGGFILGESQGNRWAKVRLLAKVWDQLEQFGAEEPHPYLLRFYGDGTFRRVYPPLLRPPKFRRPAQLTTKKT